MPHCIVCDVKCEGKRRKFCSVKCMRLFWSRKHYKDNKEEICEQKRSESNREKVRENYYKNPNIKIYTNNYAKTKRSNDPIWKLKQSIVDRIRKEKVPNYSGKLSILENHLGYSIVELYEHLIKSLPDTYKIEDYLVKHKLHVDHIIPLHWYIIFEAGDEEFKKCWNLRNLRLISSDDNMKRCSKNKLILWKEVYQLGLEDLFPKGINELKDKIILKIEEEN